ncbi:MAG: RNA polymerase sigma factor [Candidatus Brennerbacteria bacterium]|nr:RNA polymerase sigma factor [Candidatus Brennerbacteria bacterium]
MNEKTDEEIAREIQSGARESFGILVERYEERLLRYARRFFFEDADAEDLVQEVFIKAYENIQSFDPARRFSPWIYRIAHNEFVNALKRRAGKETVSFFDLDVILPPLFAKEEPERAFERQELREEMERHLGALDVKYREPLTLYYFEEMNYREIADILKIPVATVGVRLNRGRILLKNLLTT